MVSLISKQCLHREYNYLQGKEIEMLFLLHPCLYKDKIVFKIQMTREWYALYNPRVALSTNMQYYEILVKSVVITRNVVLSYLPEGRLWHKHNCYSEFDHRKQSITR